MELYGQQDKSIPQKILIHLVEIILIWISYWIMFQKGGDWFEKHLHINNADGADFRRTIILAFSIIIFLRMAYSTFFLVKRKISWEESLSIPFAFALYYIGFSLFVLPESQPLGLLDFFAIFIFIIGCVLNTGGEILRDIWKKKPDNKGKIYTGGFFRYSRHINYFGDLLWVIAFAMITRNWFAVSIPILLFFFFAFYNAPKLDEYLQGKYGKEYDNYAAKTKMLIPYIF